MAIEAKNEAKIVTPDNKGFQSPQALEAKLKSDQPKVYEGEPQPAVAGTVVAQEVRERLVKIRPRTTIARTRIGGQWYSFEAGKDCLVPPDVRRLLEEKGHL